LSATAVRSPTEFESRLQRYLFERSEEGRAVRVGEKEVSEQAAIVARFADLFSREQLEALREAEAGAEGDEAALAGLAQPVQPLALIAVGALLLVAQRAQLLATEEIRVAGDDRGLLGNLLLPHAHGAALFGTFVQVALKLHLELGGRANRSGRAHRPLVGR